MKITIFGLTLSSSWGNGHATPYRAIIRALSAMGHDVTFFEKDVPYYAKRRDFNLSDFCDLVLYRDWEEVRNHALRLAAESDVVITASYLPGGAQISDEVLDLPRPMHVFYDLDTPITLKQLRDGDLDYLRRNQIPEFDLYLSFTGGPILDELRNRWGAKAVAPIYGCVDPNVHFRVVVPEEYRSALSYMGTYAADRKQKLEELFFAPARELPDEKFVLAGSMYPAHMQLPANMKHFEHVGPKDHAALYSSSRLTLNITRAEMAERGYCPSGRLFEAAACGTPLLSDNWQGLNEFFIDGEEILIVKDTADVLAAMKMNDGALTRIADRARERTLNEHTGQRRAQQILRAVDDAQSQRRENRRSAATEVKIPVEVAS